MDAFLIFIAFALLVAGALTCIVAWFWFVLRAFGVNPLLGMGSIFVPFVADPIFMFTHWEDAKHPFFTSAAGTGLIILGVSFLALLSPETLRPSSNDSQVVMADEPAEEFEDFDFGNRSKPEPQDSFRLLAKRREKPPNRSDRVRAIKRLPSTVDFDRASVLLLEEVKVIKRSGNTFDGVLQEVRSDRVIVRQHFGSGRMDIPIRADDIDRIDWNP